MKQKQLRSGRKLKVLFCTVLAGALASGIALSSSAMDAKPNRYDIKIESAATHTAALSQGDLYLWGVNSQNQFPDSTLASASSPVKLKSGVADVAVSPGRTLTVSAAGELRAYGEEPATGLQTPRAGRAIARDVAQVDASATFAAYVSKDGALYAWGLNNCGQLGSAVGESSAEPVLLLEKDVVKVSLGNAFGLALTADGSVYGWGDNSFLQLGRETEDAVVTEPIRVTGNIADISAGYVHACLLDKNGNLWTCGDNSLGQLGTDDGLNLPHGLTKVFSGVRGVSAGTYHNFAVSNDGSSYAWGYGQLGQLGNGTLNRVMTPEQTEMNYIQVFAEGDATFAVISSGTVYSFGDNINYLLATSNDADNKSPMPILDKDMNWIYEASITTAESAYAAQEAAESDGDEAAEEPAGTHALDGSAAGEEEAAEEEKEPEIVSTVFISGDGEGHFFPANNVTRAEFLRMVVSGLCDDFDPAQDYGAPSFSDIPVGKWFENYVAYAEQNAIITGDGTGKFRPTDPITKADAAVIISKALKLDVDNYVPSKFQDVPAAPDRYFTKPIDALSAFGILSGDGTGYFYPFKDISRAEAVTIVALAANFIPTEAEKADYRASFSTAPFKDVEVGKWYYPYLLRSVGYVK